MLERITKARKPQPLPFSLKYRHIKETPCAKHKEPGHCPHCFNSPADLGPETPMAESRIPEGSLSVCPLIFDSKNRVMKIDYMYM